MTRSSLGSVMLAFVPSGPLSGIRDSAACGACCRRRPTLLAEMNVHGDVEFVLTSCRKKADFALSCVAGSQHTGPAALSCLAKEQVLPTEEAAFQEAERLESRQCGDQGQVCTDPVEHSTSVVFHLSMQQEEQPVMD